MFNRQHGCNEKGVVLIWCTLIMTVLLGFAGFSVDLGNWYLKIQRAQRAADAAALAGAVHLPADPTTAISVARATLANNNVSTANIDASIIRPVTGMPEQMYVRVPTQADNAFLGFLNIQKTSSFQRAGTATWRPEIKMGNFSNVLGNEPFNPTEPLNGQWETPAKKAQQRQYWLNISGRHTFQGRGDEFAAQKCNVRDWYGIPGSQMPNGCIGRGLWDGSASYMWPPGGNWAESQYTYSVTVKAGAPGNRARIQVYDPAFALTNTACAPGTWWNGGRVNWLYGSTGAINHAPGPNSPFCTGDNMYSDNNYNQSIVFNMPTTYYRVFDNDGNPLPECPGIQEFRPWGPPPGANFQTWNGGQMLNSFAWDPEFNRVFHKWVTLCDAQYSPSTTRDTVFRIQVWTDTESEGMNRFSLRSGIVSGGSIDRDNSSRYLRLAADSRLPLYSNFTNSDMRFAIAHVPMSMAGQELRFSAFDIGDCLNCTAWNSATFSLEGDSRTASGGSTTTNCIYTPVWNTSIWTNMSNCSISGVYAEAGYDGKKITIIWYVPDDYRCGETVNGTSCSLFMRVQFSGGSTQVDDANTWSLDGDPEPLRLIPNPASP